MSNDIASSCMLVSLNISCWTARKLDKGATAEVTTNHAAASDAGRFNKQIIDKNSLAEIVKISGAARTYLYDHTRAWSDNGDRVMSSKNYFEVMNALREYKAKFTAEVDNFCNAYVQHRERARLKLNSLFKDSDYPHESEVRRKFAFDFGVMPLATAGDFRVAMADEELEAVRADIEKQVSGRVQAAMAEVWEEVRGTMAKLRERLEETKSGGRLHDSLMTNVDDLLSRLPGLNLTGDAGLEQVRTLISTTFNGLEMKDIKKDKKLRDDVISQTDAILKQMQGMV